ncbi:MAG TPA: hypothetical protein VE988_30650 [Gemmataceae bacterium]|nr:hypothetical protein [Gemmataceae bacterium]
MFPLNAVLVGVEEEVGNYVRRGLANQLAEVERDCCSIQHALESLSAMEEQPRLFIVHVQAPSDIENIAQLSLTFTGWPILALINNRVDASHLLKVNRAGASQLVGVPVDMPDFNMALNLIGAQFGHSDSKAKVMAVCGATGGCGTTTLAINLAQEIASQFGLTTVLIELSLQLGMLATYLDVDPKITLPDLLAEMDRLDVYMLQQALTPVSDRLQILAGPPHMRGSSQVTPKHLLKLIEHSQRLAQVIVLDVPCSYNDMQFEVLADADEVVLVGEQTIPSVRSLKMVRDTFAPSQAATSVHALLNRYDKDVKGFKVADLQPVLEAPMLYTVARDNAAIKEAVNQGKTLRQSAPQSPALADIDALASALLKVSAPRSSSANGSGLFTRLLKAFKK